jgi:signal transduction histidine kinase
LNIRSSLANRSVIARLRVLREWLRGPERRDLLLVVLVTVAAIIIAVRFDLNEEYLDWTRATDRWPIDLEELPLAGMVAACGLAWYAWRRWRQYIREAARRAATAAELRSAMAEAERAQADLATANARLRDAIEAIPEGFVLFDSDDRIVLWNRRYEEIYDDRPGNLVVGRTFEEIVRHAAASGRIPRAVDQPEEWVAERLAYHALKQGSHEQYLAFGRWVLAEERRTANGDSVGIRIDITEQKAREQELRLALDRAEVANRAKSEFLGNMSHELRTPLNAILGFSEILAHEVFGPLGAPNYREFARDIHNAGAQLLRVVSDILDLARVEADRLELNLEAVWLSDAGQEVVHMTARQAAEAGVTLRADLVEHGRPALADKIRLRQALLHLLSNAIKFTPAGGTVSLETRLDQDRLAFIVGDTGIGMAERDIALALAPFGQVESSLSRRHQGAGLGLPLARRLTEAMGGSLTLESQPGRGTRVVLELPVHDQEAPMPGGDIDMPAAEAPLPRAAGEGR